MLCNEEREVCIGRLKCGILVAVSVNGDNAVCILVNNCSLGVHTECTNSVTVLGGTVNYLALVKLVGDVREYLCGKLNTHTDINTAGFGGYG